MRRPAARADPRWSTRPPLRHSRQAPVADRPLGVGRSLGGGIRRALPRVWRDRAVVLTEIGGQVPAVGGAGVAARSERPAAMPDQPATRRTHLSRSARNLGIAACFTLPFPMLRHWWWVPLIADLGTAYLITMTAFFMIRRLYKQVLRGDSD